MTLLRGIVRSGKGNFSLWLAKLEAYYTERTGMKLYPGTLNVHLSDAIFPTPKDAIRLEKEEYGGRVSVSMAPCRIFGRKAFILRPDTDDGKYGDPPEKITDRRDGADIPPAEVGGPVVRIHLSKSNLSIYQINHARVNDIFPRVTRIFTNLIVIRVDSCDSWINS